jgi:hypothetical protein
VRILRGWPSTTMMRPASTRTSSGGIRNRRAYQTRHTYATTALMAGVNPTYISRQLGHANAKMLFTVYAKWIDSADRGREKAKMEAVLRFHSADIHLQTNSKLSRICPSTPANVENTGRHDWTRTNLRSRFHALSGRYHREAHPVIALKYPRKTHKKTHDFAGVPRGILKECKLDRLPTLSLLSKITYELRVRFPPPPAVDC